MTQLTDEHFELHSANKDRKYQSEQKLKARIDILEKALEDIHKILKEAYENSYSKRLWYITRTMVYIYTRIKFNEKGMETLWCECRIKNTFVKKNNRERNKQW